MQNSIGALNFLFLQGVVEWWQESAIELTRPAVDGVGYLQTGARGVPFMLTSIVDAPDYPTAVLELRNYEALINQNPVDLVQDDLPMGSVFVLAVKPVTCRNILGAVGGINAPSTAILVCQWTLRAVGTFPPIEPFSQPMKGTNHGRIGSGR